MTIRPKWDQMNFNGKSIMGIWNLDLAWKNTLQHYPCVDWWKTQDTVGQMIISLRNKSHISSSCVLWDQCQRPLDVPVMSFWWTCSMLVTCVVRVLLPILLKGVMSWIISLSDRYLRVNLCEFSFCARCPGLCICISEASWEGVVLMYWLHACSVGKLSGKRRSKFGPNDTQVKIKFVHITNKTTHVSHTAVLPHFFRCEHLDLEEADDDRSVHCLCHLDLEPLPRDKATWSRSTRRHLQSIIAFTTLAKRQSTST